MSDIAKDVIENLEREKRSISFDGVLQYEYEYKAGFLNPIDKHIINILKEKPTLLLYEKLKLVKQERQTYYFTNLGVWCSNLKGELFPLLKIECARFKGTTTKVFIDQATFDGDIIDSIEKSIDFIKRNIKLGATIGEVYREDRWEYPLLAIREVVVNAVVHRDYSILGSDIKIAIFDDLIEITSPGVLIIDKEKLGLGYSELRNQNLGSLLKKMRIIEQWGTGYEKIAHELKEYPEINMEIDDSSSFVQIRFLKQKEIQETTQEIRRSTSRELVLLELSKNRNLTRDDLAQIIGISSNAIKQHLSNLQKDGFLKRVGSTKAGHWEVLKGLENDKR